MTTSIAIEDVRREVKILKALAGNKNLVQFYDAYEDNDNVYIVMELCEGGELLDRILSRGGKYSEDDAKAVLVQILNVVAFCHIQGVVHRDLKPENFLFTSKDDDSHLKAIDFGLSDFVKPDERLNDIVGSAYYVAPEVLHRCYSTEADVWSIGVIAYILLCGSRPFWARTESGIFRSVLKADPSYNEAPWPSLTPEAMDFVKRLLCKDPRRRMTAAQALSHPWIRNYNDIKLPLDILIFRLIKAYIRSSSLRKAALRALSKTLTVDELFYLKSQFSLLEPDRNGCITLDNIRMALTREATDAMKESRVQDILVSLSALQYRRMEFQEFCAAAVSVHQLEALDRWEQHARSAYEHFEKEGNRAIVIDELASYRVMFIRRHFLAWTYHLPCVMELINFTEYVKIENFFFYFITFFFYHARDFDVCGFKNKPNSLHSIIIWIQLMLAALQLHKAVYIATIESQLNMILEIMQMIVVEIVGILPPEEVFLLQKPKKIFCFHEREAHKLYKNLAHFADIYITYKCESFLKQLLQDYLTLGSKI
ncbi:hypothetical protein ACJX0J_032584 [Zea mays]